MSEVDIARIIELLEFIRKATALTSITIVVWAFVKIGKHLFDKDEE